MKIIKNIGKGIAVLILSGFVLGLLIACLPFIIIYAIFSYFEDTLFHNAYTKYLHSIEGACFFCYNNRETSKAFIETEIIPNLSDNVEIVYVEGKSPRSDYTTEYIAKALFNIKNRSGYPYLLYVSEGKVVDLSINKEVYQTLDHASEPTLLNTQIASFFSTAESGNTPDLEDVALLSLN